MNVNMTLSAGRFKSQLSLLSKLLENVSKSRRNKILRDLRCLPPAWSFARSPAINIAPQLGQVISLSRFSSRSG